MFYGAIRLLNNAHPITLISSSLKLLIYSELFWPNFQDQIGLSHIMADAISRNTGARYRSTSEANIAGFISGTSADYASGFDRIPHAFTIYAPAGGANGWDVPETEINRIVDEIFFAVAAAGNYAVNLPFPPTP